MLPGVGAFADASATMIELGQMDVIRRRIEAGGAVSRHLPGASPAFEEGEEGAPETGEEEEPMRPRGLSVLPGVVARMPRIDAAGRAFKVPHVGWNEVVPASGDGRSPRRCSRT